MRYSSVAQSWNSAAGCSCRMVSTWSARFFSVTAELAAVGDKADNEVELGALVWLDVPAREEGRTR